MKIKLGSILAIIMLFISAGAFAQDKKPDPRFHIYLCFGQSNMEAGARPEEQDKGEVDQRFQMLAAVDMPRLNRTKGQWYLATPPLNRGENNMGPVDFFGRTMVANLPRDYRVGVINVSVAGAKIELWQKDIYTNYLNNAETWMKNICKQYDGNPYQRLVDMTKIAQKDGVIKGILLHQGESNPNDQEWCNKVKGIYDNLMKELNLKPEEVPFLAGELKSAEEGGKCAGFNTAVLANLPKTLPNSYIISSKGCKGTGDAFHFNTAGMRELGKRYALQMLKLEGFKPKEAPATPPAAGAVAPVPAPRQPVTATIDTSMTGPPISPFIYGQFIEHAGGIIYSALWSEMLDDRKFYYAVQPKPAEDPAPVQRGPGGFGPGRRRGVGPGRWNPIGPVDTVVMDTNNPFSGDHTPLIKLAGSEPRGIRQTGIIFTKGETYKGRIQLAGDSKAKVSINIEWGTNTAVRPTVAFGKLGKNFKKFTFSFKAENSGPAQFEVTGTGTGSFHVGAVSLMPADNLDGFKPDAIAALKSLRSGVYRFPGGNFVSAHEWRDAIGDQDKRPPTWDPVRRDFQPNDIGTDEFMTLCKLLDVEPYITVNAGTGDAWSAAQYVEYANGDVTTPMGKQRAANGHPEPYKVKFWGIGNEMWGNTYQYGAMRPNQYAFKHNQFAKAMRKADPTITLLASGAMPDTMIGSKESLSFGTNLVPAYFSPADWTGMLLTNCFSNFELISEHYYNYGNTHFSLAEGRQVPNDPNESVTDWMRRAANHVRIKYEHYQDYERLLPQLAAQPKPLAISEWAYTGGKYPAYPALAWVFHEMFRHSDLIQMANYTFGTSLLTRGGTNASLNANGLVFKLYGNHFGHIPVAVIGNSPQPKPTAPPGGEQPLVNAGSDTFPLDVCAAWTRDRRALTVAVLNPTDVEQSLKLNITGASLSGKCTLWRLASTADNGENPSVSNSPIHSPPDLLILPRFSVSIYEFAMGQ